MTIAVKIENQDSTRTIRVTTLAYEKGKAGERETQHQHIQPGKSAILYVHQLQSLRLDELEPDYFARFGGGT